MNESAGKVYGIERQVSEMHGKDLPVEKIGALLDAARRLYLRQVDPNRLCPVTGQPRGPLVEWNEVILPFDGGLLERLETAIETLERAFNGSNPDDPALMKKGLARVPTEKEYWEWIENM